MEDDDGFGRDTVCNDCGNDEFPSHFKALPDHRQAGKVDYPLPEVLLLFFWRFSRGRRRSPT